MRDRRVPLGIRDHPPAGLRARFLAESNFDHAIEWLNLSVDDGEIIFLDPPRLERLLQNRSRLGIAREEQASGRVLVQPVHRRRRTLEAQLQLAEPLDNAVAASARRVDRQPRGLVDDNRFGVDEEDPLVEH